MLQDKINYLSIKGLIILVIFVLAGFIFAGKSNAASSGYYISHALGSNEVLGFTYFRPEGVKEPAKTSITYSFAGSKDDYKTWTKPETTGDKIDLAKFTELTDSKFIKVKIEFFSDEPTAIPSLEGYSILAKIPTGNFQVIGAIPVPSGQPTPEPVVKGADKVINDIKKPSLASLVSTGSTLWFNILVAIIIGGLIAYFIIRAGRKKETPNETKSNN